MKEHKRYYKVQSHSASSTDDIKAFARSILLEDGINIDVIDISDEGIKIGSFKKLVKALYNAGYRDGLEQTQTLRGQVNMMERDGLILTRFQRKAKSISENNLGNKI